MYVSKLILIDEITGSVRKKYQCLPLFNESVNKTVNEVKKT